MSQSIDLMTLMLVLVVAASSGMVGGALAEWVLTPIVEKSVAQQRANVHPPIRNTSASRLSPDADYAPNHPLESASITQRGYQP